MDQSGGHEGSTLRRAAMSLSRGFCKQHVSLYT
jgi:hypothetical protein